jgi:DNA-directed RNA polymerase beta subunit
MQRQAVPLLRPEAPFVGTGLEGHVVRDSRVLVNAEHSGVVEYVDANEIHIRNIRSDLCMCRKIRCDEESDKFCENYKELNKA